MARRQLTLASVERTATIIEMRTARRTFREIGDQLGLSPTRVHELYWSALKAIPAERIGELRQEANALSDMAVSRLIAITEDPKCSNRTAVEAWGAICRWARHSAQLNGLDVDRNAAEVIEAGVPQNLHELVAKRVVELRAEAAAS